MVFELVLATSNAGKLRELQALLAPGPWRLHTPQDMGIFLKVEEAGETYAANAYLKARAWAQATGKWSLADDTGLEVQALGGAPGLYSARFGPQDRSLTGFAERRAYLLSLLQEHPRPWVARFRCVVALVHPRGTTLFAEGELWGEIVPEERGEHGFGYDPIFWVPHLGKTLAELTLEEKNQISHRARALRALRPALEGLVIGEARTCP